MSIPPLFRHTVFFAGVAVVALLSAGLHGHIPTLLGVDNPQQREGLQKSVRAASTLAAKGQYAAALTAFRELQPQAAKLNDTAINLTILNNIGGCQLGLRQYPDALRTFLIARRSAAENRKPAILAQVNVNLASIYLKMNNLQAASEAIQLALKDSSGVAPAQRISILQLAAHIAMAQGRAEEGEGLYRKSIALASELKQVAAQAGILEYFSFDLLDAGDAAGAADAAKQALQIRLTHQLSGTEIDYWYLGRAARHQGEAKFAESYFDQALSGAQDSSSTLPLWALYRDRGMLRLETGQLNGAVADLRLALEQSRQLNIVPTEENRIASADKLAEVYDAFLEAGTRLARETHFPQDLVDETFDVNQQGREASLRALTAQRTDANRRPPPEFAEKIAQLQRLERAELRSASVDRSERISNLKVSLEEMEVAAGLSFRDQNIPARQRVGKVLKPDTALLSFWLGEHGSWLWTQTTEGLFLVALPAKSLIARASTDFSNAVATGAPDAAPQGQALYRMLFQDAEKQIESKPRWLLSLDQDLFRLPFAALVMRRDNGRPVYLMESHLTQAITGAYMLSDKENAGFTSGKLMGIGDPVYNAADPRTGMYWPPFQFMQPRPDVHLARLPGSGRELATVSSTWGPGARTFTGTDASRINLGRAVAEHPAVLHIATHILESPLTFHSGMIGLSMGQDGNPELVTAEEIVGYSDPANLVVLSGCNSGRGNVSAASGLMGLTRAWIGAGARSVMATLWPTQDDSGELFREFYTRLRGPGITPPEALRQTQVAMLRSGSFRAQPQQWAAYFLVGNYR
jgi:CHAT domain-containing protein